MMDLGQEGVSAHEEQQRLNEGHAANTAIQSEAIIAEIGVLERERETEYQADSRERVVKSSQGLTSKTWRIHILLPLISTLG